MAQPAAGLPGLVVPVPRLGQRIRRHISPRLQDANQPLLQGIGHQSGCARLRGSRWFGSASLTDLPGDQLAIRASGLVAAIHRAPHRLECQEELLPALRDLGPAKRAEHGQAVQRVAIHDHVRLSPRITGVHAIAQRIEPVRASENNLRLVLTIRLPILCGNGRMSGSLDTVQSPSPASGA